MTEAHFPLKIEASKDNTSQMTPQKTMWQLYSKFQPEEEASGLQIPGMMDLLFEKSLCYYVIPDIRNIFRVIVIKIDNFYLKDFAFTNKDTSHYVKQTQIRGLKDFRNRLNKDLCIQSTT